MDRDQMFALAVTLAAGTAGPAPNGPNYTVIRKHVLNCYAALATAYGEELHTKAESGPGSWKQKPPA